MANIMEHITNPAEQFAHDLVKGLSNQTDIVSKIKGKIMSVKTKKYQAVPSGQEIRAIKVSERNFESVAAWVKGEGRTSVVKGETVKHRVAVPTPKGVRVANVGDFVYKSADGTFRVGKAGQFESDFRLV